MAVSTLCLSLGQSVPGGRGHSGWPEEQHSRPGGILLPSTLLPGKPALPCLPAQAVLPALRGSDHRQSRLCHSAPVTPSELAGLSASPGTLSALGLPLCAPVPSRLLPRAPSPPTPTLRRQKTHLGLRRGDWCASLSARDLGQRRLVRLQACLPQPARRTSQDPRSTHTSL